MITIAPSILAPDLNSFAVQAELFSTFAKRIQLDIVDGNFAPTRTIQLNNIDKLPSNETIWDFHMMVETPSKTTQDVVRLKPNLCIFHAEVDERLQPIFENLHSSGIRVGVALLPGTYPGDLRTIIGSVDHVLIFAGSLGRQGGTADLLQLEKVEIIRSINPNVEISWDGGANVSNIRAIANSGLNVVTVGSAISHSSDPATTFKELNTEADRPGVLI